MNMTFGERIRLLRENLNMNQTQLGSAVHMTQRKISYIENDTFEPSLVDIQAFCRFFHVSADYLLGFSRHLPYPKKRS